MEGNIFASFSFTSPSKSTSRRAGKLNVCNSAAVVPSSSPRVDRAQRDFRAQQIKDEICRRDSKLLSDPESVSSSSSSPRGEGKQYAVGSSQEEVKERVDVELLEKVKRGVLIDVKKETEDEFCHSKGSPHDLSSVSMDAGKRKMSSVFLESDLEEFEDIEDWTRGSRKFSPTPLEKEATSLWKKKGMNTYASTNAVAPSDWENIVEGVRKMRIDRDAPVDLLGPGQLVDRSKGPETQKFHVLVAAILSSQTRDAITAGAMRRLHSIPGGLTAQRVAEDDLTVEALEEVLKPVGFYRQKAKYLKTIASMLVKPPYCGSVPSTLSELMKFPGVGPKIGLVVLWAAFGKNDEGFICDSNVRRVCCRLGWVPADSTPGETREALEKWLPKDLWAELSYLFVGFGQQICKPLRPMCQICKISSLCPSAFKCGKKRPKSTKETHELSCISVQLQEEEVPEDI